MEISGDISPALRKHILLVYARVVLGMVAVAAGAWVHIMWYQGLWGTLYWILGGLGLILTYPHTKGENLKLHFLLGVSVWAGFVVAPGLRVSLCCYPARFLITILMGAAVSLGSLIGSTIVAKRRSLLYVSGLVSAVSSFLLWLCIVSMIYGRGKATFRNGVYIRFMACLVYSLFDLHQILDKANRGDTDYVRHSIILLGDVLVVLLPLPVILVKIYYNSGSVAVVDDLEEDSSASLTERAKGSTDSELKLHAVMILVCLLLS